MALDVGDVRIGVALSDPLFITAQGLKTIERTNIRWDTTQIIDIIKEQEVSTVVLGLPLGLAGNDTPQTEKVRQFKIKLENKIKSSGLKNIDIVFSDERFTTSIAEDVLIQGDVSRRDRKSVVDKMAATIILQGYLNRREK